MEENLIDHSNIHADSVKFHLCLYNTSDRIEACELKVTQYYQILYTGDGPVIANMN